MRSKRRLTTPADVDLALYDYLATGTKSFGATVIAAVERIYPPLRGQLSWARARQRAAQAMQPTAHHLPMPWLVALGLAAALSSLGQRRLGALLLLQWRLGLRPGEAIRLTRGALIPASSQQLPSGQAAVRLGMRQWDQSTSAADCGGSSGQLASCPAY